MRKVVLTIIVIMGAIFIFLLIFISSLTLVFTSVTKGSGDKQVLEPQKYDMTPGITRKKVVDAALSLDKKVKYFWGGRSEPGWNDKWGTPQIVTAPGDWTSGTYQPYGLDCSGFVDWAFKTAGSKAMYGTTASQLVNSYAIDEKDLKPGDLVFRFDVEQAQVNHVGIFVKRENGVKYYVHCQGGTGVIVNNSPTFQYWRRPYVKFEDD